MSTYRFAVGIAIVAALMLVWLSLGVGIIGRDGDPANRMYFGVIAVGIIGALIARFRPSGMARALFAMAAASRATATPPRRVFPPPAPNAPRARAFRGR